jgi:transcriptional regulator with XRE-family HTH domain
VRELRRARGLSQVELAHLARMSRVFVGDVEKGSKSASIDTLEKLASALGVAVAELLKAPAKNPLRSTVQQRLLSRLSFLIQSAPPEELVRFEKIAESFFEAYRPRRRTRRV